MAGKTSINRKEARVRSLEGFEAVSKPFDLDRTVQSGGVGRWARRTVQVD